MEDIFLYDRGWPERGQNSPAHCRVVAQNAPSRSENVCCVRILGWPPGTAWV